ncbi:hypothetical protein T484DRAFT_1633517, partial [Baffinella frigidus]
GTKRYMAPEVLNREDYSNKADVWSLGCVLFELLTLNHPTYEQVSPQLRTLNHPTYEQVSPHFRTLNHPTY